MSALLCLDATNISISRDNMIWRFELSSTFSKRRTGRRELADQLFLAGREHSAATVMFHASLAGQRGLAATDTKTLDTLLRLGPLTAGELAQHTGLATASVTALIDRLERKGMVRRARDPQDRRRVIVEPVRKQSAADYALFTSIRRSYEGLLDRYTDEQLETILDFLRQSAATTRLVTANLERKHLRLGRAT
jgi:DNA-binding MarR family transcriptional regulator